mgnify:CR=1 FL=1
MKVGCPHCGAEVEFRYDDSLVRVCAHCRSAVVRTDRGVDTLGQFADLVPIESPLRLFAEGRYGSAGFQLIGMAQLRHASGGMWQEWYAKLDGGQWAWLSEAQGRLYLTFERPELAAPPREQLTPGATIELGGAHYTIAERGAATYVAALGEIPYRLAPGATYAFADLSDGRGGFATIDYGDGSESPTVYLGAQVAPASLGLAGGEAPAPAGRASQGARLACPNCNGALELRAPDQSLRVACPYCASLVSVEAGTLSILARQANKPRPAIPLGATARLADGELTVIGFVARSAYVDGTWWPFEEYLLYAPRVGFRWLVCSDGHWSYVQPVAPGAVSTGAQVRYDGVAFKPYQYSVLRVDAVLGELYWRVTVGERVTSADYVAPPAMLSRESNADEVNWSLATYLTPAAVKAALAAPGAPPIVLGPPTGIAPNQPGPVGLRAVASWIAAAFVVVTFGKCVTSPGTIRLQQGFVVPMQVKAKPAATSSSSWAFDPTPPADPAAAPAEPTPPPSDGSAGAPAPDPSVSVSFSDKFKLSGGRNVEVTLTSPVNNNWVYAALDLINEDTGAVVSLDKSIEYYSGYDSDGSWSEGDHHASEVLGPVPGGTYVLRVEAQHGGAGDEQLHIELREGVFRWLWFWIGLGVIALPIGLTLRAASRFERQRWENSSLVAMPIHVDSRGAPARRSDDDDDDEEDDDDD